MTSSGRPVSPATVIFYGGSSVIAGSVSFARSAAVTGLEMLTL